MLKSFLGGRLFGDQYGSGDISILALHGWRRTRTDFAFLNGRDAVALDLPGFGLSPEPESVWGTEDYAAVVAQYLQTLDLQPLAAPPVLLGHSFGGRVAVRLAAAHPELAGGLVLTGTPLIRRVRPGARSPWRLRAAKRLDRWGLAPRGVLEAQRHRFGSADYRAESGLMRDTFVRVVNESYVDDLAALRCKTAFVWGDDDTEAPADLASEAAALVADSTLTLLPGVGHQTPLAAPQELLRALDVMEGSCR